MTKLEASYIKDGYPGSDFWEVERTFEIKVNVMALAESREEDPSVSFANGVLNQKLPGMVTFDEQIEEWLEDYFERHPEAATVFEDMCRELAFKTGGNVAIDGATKGPTKSTPPTPGLNQLIKDLGLKPTD